MSWRKPLPGPKQIARRALTLRPNREFEIIALETGIGVDCWLRLRTIRGVVGQFLLPASRLREVARCMDELAGELGIEP